LCSADVPEADYSTENQSWGLDPMIPARTAALKLLQSPDFFADLRGALSQAELTGEEKPGEGVFFALMSRWCPNPLRLAIWESTDGSAKYALRKVSQLLGAGNIRNVVRDQGWSDFVAGPAHKVAYVPEWTDWSREGTRIEIDGNTLTRILQREHDGRIVETPHMVEAPFVCVSPRLPEFSSRSRRLTIRWPAPPPVSKAVTRLDEEELSMWLEVQHLVRDRAKLPILLPDWGDVVIERACQDERSAPHVPAFLQSWKTMALLRSFRSDDGHERNMLQANFEDLAMTSLLLRGVFREGHWFPSPANVFNEIFPVGEERSVINPFTGKGVRYIRRQEKAKSAGFVSLL
jgi:hypothetical protein